MSLRLTVPAYPINETLQGDHHRGEGPSTGEGQWLQHIPSCCTVKNHYRDNHRLWSTHHSTLLQLLTAIASNGHQYQWIEYFESVPVPVIKAALVHLQREQKSFGEFWDGVRNSQQRTQERKWWLRKKASTECVTWSRAIKISSSTRSTKRHHT